MVTSDHEIAHGENHACARVDFLNGMYVRGKKHERMRDRDKASLITLARLTCPPAARPLSPGKFAGLRSIGSSISHVENHRLRSSESRTFAPTIIPARMLFRQSPLPLVACPAKKVCLPWVSFRAVLSCFPVEPAKCRARRQGGVEARGSAIAV